jgi:predicted O-methyltransferase YrrM
MIKKIIIKIISYTTFKLGILLRRNNPRISTEKFSELGKDLVGVEIGTCTGYNAKTILKRVDIKKLYLVDPYTDYEELTDNNPNLSKSEKDAQNLLKKYSDKIIWVKKLSMDAVNDIPNELDFVYIDGNHRYEYVKKDMELYFPKLKKGGILAGHDIENATCPEHDGLVTAVIEFALKNGLQLYIRAPDWIIYHG